MKWLKENWLNILKGIGWIIFYIFVFIVGSYIALNIIICTILGTFFYGGGMDICPLLGWEP